MAPVRRRFLTILVCAALVACGGDDDGGDEAVAGDTSSTSVAPAPGADGTSDTTAGGGEPGPTGGGDQPTPTVVAGEPAPDQPSSPQQESAARGEAGSFAREILAGSGEILVEVLSQQTAMPHTATLDHVIETLQEVSGKPTTGAIVGAEAPADDSWTAEELRALADASGTPQSEGRVVLHLLFLNGRWHESDTVLGVAVRGDTAAVFVEAVADAASPLVGSAAIEEAATLHEVGHLLGLVDLFLDTGRADPEHPGHSPNRSSVMYWAVESTLITDVLAGGPPREFDADDLRDLATIRGS